MAVQKLFIRKTQFVFAFRNMVFIIRVLWVSFFTCMFTLFGFSRQCLFRFQEKFITQKQNYNLRLIQSEEDHQINPNITEVEDNKDVGEGEELKSEPLLRFRFPTYEEFLGKSTTRPMLENLDDKIGQAETKEDYVGYEINPIAKSSTQTSHVEEITKREIGSESKENSGIVFVEYLHVENVFGIRDCSFREDTNVTNSNGETSQQDAASVICNDVRHNSGEIKAENGVESILEVTNLKKHEEIIKNDSEFPSDDESLGSDFESDSIAPNSMSSFRSSFIDSLSDGILSDIDFERAFEIDTSTEFGWDEENSTKEALTKEDFLLQDLSKGYGDDDCANENEDLLEELKNIESNLEHCNRALDKKHESKMGSKAENKQNEEENFKFENLNKGYEADDCDDEDEDILKELKSLVSNSEDDNGTFDKEQGVNMEREAENKQNEEKPSSGEQLSSDSDEQNGLETQWEHQDLVEQLKMEIRKVQAIGLPTILEESESPKISDDLKPWKIVEKYHHGGTLDELHKFYKTYKERMRKLDILNYQKMYAIGFLRLKDPLQSFTKNKISTSLLATIVSLDCWPCKPKSVPEIHQPVMKKFSIELESDLEMVYVGQMCLSWEFLRWQYDKALELWDTDPHGIHQYNEVADKFQTFQVLLTRFLEDEIFQGPRVHNYVKNRCVQQNLLQVPLIRDDNTRKRRKERKGISSKDAITSSQLVEIIEESIRILWQFIKSDKDTNNVTLLKCRRTSSNVELQNPADASLLGEIRSNLQKKEKKLELSRSEKCILRKIQEQQEEASDHVLYFFSQVDLRLVSRVLNMPRITTEQLVWCSDKLNNIHLVGRKLHVQPSVFLFPCS